MDKPVLVFPAGMPRSVAYLEGALAEGRKVIGASSLGHDPVRERYPHWEYLPYVTASDFNDALRALVDRHGIGGIFSPNPVVWDHLNRCLAQLAPGVRLVNSAPVDKEMEPYRRSLRLARDAISTPLQCAASGVAKPPAGALEIASLLRHADAIPGMCDFEKMRALCDVLRYAPSGDLVEIGSWWGRSAFVLLRLAQIYGIGKLLCVDPWSDERLIQKDEKGMVDRVPVSADEALTVFQLNLLPYARDGLNYLRLPSEEALPRFLGDPSVETPEFGRTTYSGGLALLHVDGNHSYSNARYDIVSWSGLVKSGGWIVVDDYIWPYGDGPMIAGDEFLEANIAGLSCAFVMGSALFIQVR